MSTKEKIWEQLYTLVINIWFVLHFITVIDQETFAAFTHCWKENSKQCLNLGINDADLLEAECVLKVSSLCKTDFGTGRVALTDRR